MEEILSAVKRIHLIGIGGIGMSGLALLLCEKGYCVTGSDIAESPLIEHLKTKGVTVFRGHTQSNIEDTDLVCYSSAINQDNPELRAACKAHVPILPRAKLLSFISRGKNTIAISGSHGKTTTSALLGYMLHSLGHNPTVFIGGIPVNYDTHAWWGSDYCVIEADESDGSFLYYDPEVSIITNIDKEHLDFYKDVNTLHEAFGEFARRAKKLVITCGDDEDVMRLLGDVHTLTYGVASHNKVRAENLHFDGKFMNFDLVIDKMRQHVKSPLLGEHNVLNVLAVLSFIFYQQVDLEEAIRVLRNFRGIKRRFEVKAIVEGVTFMDDYAHHPAEIRAVLRALKGLGHERIVAVFQPHRFSRVQALADEFSRCFYDADYLVVTDIYAAGEEPIPGIGADSLYHEIKKEFKGIIEYVPTKKLAQRVAEVTQRGDLVVGLGAGTINKTIDDAARRFKRATLPT